VRGNTDNSTQFGVTGNNTDGGTGVEGNGGTGVEGIGSLVGVKGQTVLAGGIGVEAQGNGSNTTALMIDNGAIEVHNSSGARPIFSMTDVSQLLCNNDHALIIDSPYSNGNINALIFISLIDTGTFGTVHPVRILYNNGGGPMPTCPADKWVILHIDGSAFGQFEEFGIMIVDQAFP
jgi:hypothetical protein